MTEDAPGTVPETESSKATETIENASLTEPVADDSAKSDLPRPSTCEISDKDKVAEDTATRESIASNKDEKDETENLPEGLQEQENEQPSHSQKDSSVDENEKELENLDSEATRHVDTSDNLNIVELDSTAVAQNLNNGGSEAQSDSTEPEISSVAESKAISENEMQAAKQAASHESDTKENSKLHSSAESTVGKKVGNLPSQVATDETSLINVDSRTLQMYPNLDTVARESGIIF